MCLVSLQFSFRVTGENVFSHPLVTLGHPCLHETRGKCHFTIENLMQYYRNVNLPQVDVSRASNLLCELVSRSSCEYCISKSSNLSNLSNTVLNSFGISNKVLLGTSD